MKKISIKNVLKYATLCIAVAFIFFSALFCMDKPDVGTLSASGEIILSLLEGRRGNLDHFARCILGSTCKKWNKLLIDDAPERKKELAVQARNLSKCPFSEYEKTVIWHKYGSAWGRIIDTGTYHNIRQYSLEMLYLRHKKIYTWSSSTEFDFGRPRFNERGDFVYYFLTLKGDPHEVREYGYRSGITCRLLLEKDDYCERFMEMGFLTAFPHFLHKCLSDLTLHKSGRFKFCDLQKMIVPDDYKTCKPNSECKSWSELDEDLREIIDKRYREQKK